MKIVLIAGDSWGSGEWDYREGILTNTHFGLEYFIKYGFKKEVPDTVYTKVNNISIPASSNNTTLVTLNNVHDIDSYDYIIVFVTDFLRNIPNDPITNKFPFELVSSKEKIQKLHYKIESEFYEGLSTIKNNIILLGGLSKVNLDLLKNYKNLSSPIPSIIEFIRPDIKKQYDFYVENILPAIPDNIDVDYFNFIHDQFSIWESVYNGLFFLQDRNHPDRNAHLLIYNELEKHLKFI